MHHSKKGSILGVPSSGPTPDPGTPYLSRYRSRSLVTRTRNHKCTTPNMGSKPTPVLEVQGRGGSRALPTTTPVVGRACTGAGSNSTELIYAI